MTETPKAPRRDGPLFALPPGADFPRALVRGLCARMAGRPPEDMARVELYLNTRRMQRRVRELFAAEGARLLPRIRLVTDLGRELAMADLPPPVPPLRRRLELARLVSALLDRQPDLAPRAAIYDLADSLATLMDEMQGEGVPPERIEALDLADHSRHWERSLAFLRIVARYFGPEEPPDAEARQRMVVERLADRWAKAPPDHPVIIAGSTGSRGTTLRLMQAVADLPQGIIVLPGFDFDMPMAVWDSLADALSAEDHPQYRFYRLMQVLGLGPAEVHLWDVAPAPSAARNRLVSLALRPAPVTDQWMVEGPQLADIAAATAGMTLVEAPSPRAEAMAIALRLRQAAAQGQRAALITPDRTLTRQVTAALGRWGIVPDDSAGRPLALSAPGRFLRHVAALFGERLTAETLLTLLKHPITHSGAGRGPHLLWTRDLELHLRRKGPAFPTGAAILDWASARGDDDLIRWAGWLAALLEGLETIGERPLSDHVAQHLHLAEALAGGPEGGTGELWLKEAGQTARRVVDDLLREAPWGGIFATVDYRDLFAAVLQGAEVRESPQVHPGIMILGTLEARVQSADLVILGGLNDGVWPPAPTPDPWLNRQMRHDAGLLLPERRIGLSAHDFQQSVAAPEVILTRAIRDSEAETVPSRWLNRLTNLMGGLRGEGATALAAMRARGGALLRLSSAWEGDYQPVPPAPRPAPRPPVAARPRELAVTAISKLIRDPYAVYARYVLRLQPLPPLRPGPDALLRGSVLHRVFEEFVQRGKGDRAQLMTLAQEVLTRDVPWPAARRLWLARLDRVADWFLAQEAARPGQPVLIEERGGLTLDRFGFRLTAKPDRIDELPDGSLHIMDYKSGTPPTQKQQELFDKQLLLEAMMAERGAFRNLGPRPVQAISYIGIGSAPREERTDITEAMNIETWEELHRLIGAYTEPQQGYASRRAVFEERFPGDYDHLARYGEWEMTDAPWPEDVG
ncbi:double-strand break repair protein AddB [Halodurantibacterium flavum]|uniref:Double-strand break repair protein AddB n=1 Tax=Halodurantibacterium flavum TaxID=1382802 RepID=A0ABW4S9N3_9RHOB